MDILLDKISRKVIQFGCFWLKTFVKKVEKMAFLAVLAKKVSQLAKNFFKVSHAEMAQPCGFAGFVAVLDKNFYIFLYFKNF